MEQMSRIQQITPFIMPKEVSKTKVKLNQDAANPAPFPAFLPIEIFDNAEFDVRLPEEWINLGEHNSTRLPVPGKALLPTRKMSISESQS